MTLEFAILLLLIVAAFAGFFGFLIAKGKDNAELAGRLAQIAEDGRKSQGELAKAVGDQLDKVSARVGKSIEETATKTAKSFGEIEAQLKIFAEMSTSLSGEIVGLQGILDNKQARGTFGETQLERLIEDNLAPDAYSFQVQLSNGKRADCLINFPKPYGPIVVDSKFPLESYRALMVAENDDSRAKIGKVFKRDMKNHISQIAEKYILPEETADRALLFLPSEAIFTELHTNFGDIVEYGQKSRVAIVSPSTMWALLNAIMSVLRDIRMQEQAGLIQKAVAGLKRDVELLDERAGKLSKHFRLTQQAVDDLRTSTGRIVAKSEKITSVQLTSGGEEVEEVQANIKGPRIRSIE